MKRELERVRQECERLVEAERARERLLQGKAARECDLAAQSKLEAQAEESKSGHVKAKKTVTVAKTQPAA